jgi:single-stranded DNA-specific DHH superfamily exonuclease
LEVELPLEKWTAIIKQSEAVLSHIFKEDDALLFFHDDADGCCAAATLINLVSKQTPHRFLDFASPEKHSVELTSRLLEILEKEKPKFIISLDLALTSSVEKIKKVLNFLSAQMLVYDHHIQSKSLRWPERCAHINPLNFNLGNIPASCYSYVLYKHYTKEDDACWIGAVGTVADYRAKECQELLEEVRHRYPSLYPFKTVDQPTALRSPLMTMAHLVNAGYQHSDYSGARVAVEALNEALQLTDPTVLLEGKTKKAALLHRFRREIDKELRKYLEQFDSESESHLDTRVAFYSIKPKFNITSQIATQLQHDHPNTIIAVISPETRKTLKVSLRRGSKVKTDLATLAEATVTGLVKASGGGHQDAAGCILRNKDVNLWKKNMLEHLRRTLS